VRDTAWPLTFTLYSCRIPFLIPVPLNEKAPFAPIFIGGTGTL
jgi:hypothetical protein